MRREQDERGNGTASSGQADGAHQRAQAFFAEVAAARRSRRQAQLELAPERAIESGPSASHTGMGSIVGVRRLPGEDPGSCDTGSSAALADETPEPPGWGLSGVSSVEACRFGLNSTKTFQMGFDREEEVVTQVTKYGVLGEPLYDASRLGARVLRQHGHRDLFWGMLAHDVEAMLRGDVQASLPVPVGTSALESAMSGGVNIYGRADTNRELIGQLMYFAGLPESGVKLVSTFLTIGGGGDSVGLVPADACDYNASAVEYSSSSASPGATIDEDGVSGGVPRGFDGLGWDDEHAGQTSPYGSDFPVRAPPWSACQAWFKEALDPSCPYKREYIGMIAEAAASILWWSAYDSDLPMGTVFEAIEIFNEVDVRDFWERGGQPDLRATGEKWGRAYLHAAWRFREGLRDERTKLWMPGISSYHQVKGWTWDSKLEFVDGFVEGMVDEASEYTEAVTNGATDEPEEVLLAFPSLLQGIDLHWYHREAGEPLRHIGYLVHEIDELRQAIIGAVREYITELSDETLEESFGERFSVSVFENGWGLNDAPPEGAGALSGVEKEAFQAAEVWRRLGGALAGGASIAGWHSWMSSLGTNFQLMGLRRDEGDEWTPASDAQQRSAWHAYAILAEALGDKVVGGRMVLPATSSRADLSGQIKADAELAGVVVFEYRMDSGGRGDHWAYMVLRDPSTALSSSYRVVGSALGQPLGGRPVELSQIRFFPVSLSAGSDEELPVERGVHSSSSTPLPVTVVPHWVPKLFISHSRMSWRLEAAGALPSIAASLFSRPAWLDDPGVDPCGRSASVDAERLLGG